MERRVLTVLKWGTYVGDEVEKVDGQEHVPLRKSSGAGPRD